MVAVPAALPALAAAAAAAAPAPAPAAKPAANESSASLQWSPRRMPKQESQAFLGFHCPAWGTMAPMLALDRTMVTMQRLCPRHGPAWWHYVCPWQMRRREGGMPVIVVQELGPGREIVPEDPQCSREEFFLRWQHCDDATPAVAWRQQLMPASKQGLGPQHAGGAGQCHRRACSTCRDCKGKGRDCKAT